MRAPDSNRNRYKPGMTLVEILVVITIIGILIACIYPSVKNGINSSNGAKCLSNLRQIGVGAELYTQEHNNMFPGVDFWPNQLSPYILSKAYVDIPPHTKTAFWCPSAVPTDLGSMKRGHTCWLIDSSVSPQVSRFTQLQANRLLPAQYCNLAIVAFRDRGDANIGDHDALARMAGAMCFSGDIAAWSDALTKKMADHVAYHKSIRHLLDGDYFRILPTPVGVNDWDAGAFVSRDKKECLLFVFKVQGSDSQTLRLKGLEAGRYQVNSRGGEAVDIQRSGQQLMDEGLTVRLGNNQGSVFHLRLI